MTERERIIELVRGWASAQPLVSSVYLFGSFAKGAETASSDVDLALTTEPEGIMKPLGVFLTYAEEWREELGSLLGRAADLQPLADATKIVAPAVEAHGIKVYP